MDFYFQGAWRMDWGLGNPNKTAALIAILMMAVWAFAYFRKWGFGVALALFTGLGICLIHTFSRGGLIAAAVGSAVLLCWIPRPWHRRKLFAVGAAAWGIIAFSIFIQAHQRYGQGVVSDDRSITNRVAIWRVAPTMMVDAPGGWGIGQSGISYVRWYQSLERNEAYRTLVNSHLTWLVEFGWLGRFFYLCGWMYILLLCWPTRGTSVSSIPLAVWVSFAVSATFSSVAESGWLWIIPILALVFSVATRCFQGSWPRRLTLIVPPAFAVLACFAIFLSAGQSDALVKKRGDMVFFGKGNPEYMVLANTSTLGENYHRVLRQAAAENIAFPTVGITESVTAMTNVKGAKVVFFGPTSANKSESLKGIFGSSGGITIINPMLLPEELGLPHAKNTNIEVFFGEFAQGALRSNWNEIAPVKELPGIGDFIPTWNTMVFREKFNRK